MHAASLCVAEIATKPYFETICYGFYKDNLRCQHLQSAPPTCVTDNIGIASGPLPTVKAVLLITELKPIT